MQFHLMA